MNNDCETTEAKFLIDDYSNIFQNFKYILRNLPKLEFLEFNNSIGEFEEYIFDDVEGESFNDN